MFSYPEIARALERGEFFLEYMPTIALPCGRCVGAETLIRWQNRSEVVYPLDFIPMVENTCLSGGVTYWVIETVARELRAWLLDHEHVHIGINVPPEIIGRGGIAYAARISGLLDVADKVMIEVTERGILDQLGVDGINAALRHGQQIALDDIDTHDASLLLLSRVGTGTVKLDKAFADRMLEPDWSLQEIAGIAALIRSGSLRVIAEGIETTRQAEIVIDAGIQMAQGYYFARPMRAQDFVDWFDRHNAGVDRPAY